MKKLVSLTVNGNRYEVAVKPSTTLVDLLRAELGLTGTKKSCDTGNCGACTVILDGKTVKSCSVLALEAEGKEVLTIEGLANGSNLHPIQQSFIEHQGFQCGFCTPGMILTAKELLDENPNPTEEEVNDAINGNICRCTGYASIVRAILGAAAKMEKEAE